MKTFKGKNGVPINPKLPKNFDSTPNEERPATHQKWWNVTFIVTLSVEELDKREEEAKDKWAEERLKKWRESGRSQWMQAWPSGTRYDVRCLDGGAWDRSTWIGSAGSLEEAIRIAKNK